MSQSLYDLPEGWKWERLGDVLDVRDGTHDSPKFVETGFPLVTSKNLTPNGLELTNVKYISKEDYDSINKRSNVDMGDILFAMIGTIGNPVLITDYPEFAIKNVALFKRKKLDQCMEYVRYYLMTPYTINSMTSLSKGATQKFVGLNFLRSFQIPLPPLAEQTRIVEKLDAVLSRIDASIDELQQSLALVDAFYKSSLKAKTNDLEGKWNRYSLNELGCFSGGGTPSKSRSDYWDGEILWITPKDMKSWKLSDSEMKITDIGLKESSAKLLPKNSVLIVARSGILQHTLPVAINTVEATVNQDIKVFIPSDKIKAEYIQYMLKGHEAFILSQLVKGGVTVESLKYSEFQEHPFPVPDLQAQIQIVGELDALNDKTTQLKTELTAKIGMFNQLKASVLDGAFRGEL